MSQIDKYEICRTVACFIINMVTIVGSPFVCMYIDSFILAFGAGLAVTLFGCFLMVIFDNIFNKKIKKYKEEHGKELSQESSQL